VDLALDDDRVDDPPAVLCDHVALDLDVTGLLVDGDDTGVGRIGVHGLRRVERGGEPEALGRRGHELRDRHRRDGGAGDAHRPVRNLQVGLRGLEVLSGILEQPLAQRRARRDHGTTCGGGAA
jgi:hypothetical protein